MSETNEHTFPLLSAPRFRVSLPPRMGADAFEFVVEDHHTWEEWSSLTEFQRHETLLLWWAELLYESDLLVVLKGIPITDYEWESL